MLRKCIGLLLSVVVIFLVAGEGLGAEQTGSLQVIPVWCGEPVTGGTISLCRVGTVTDGGIQVTDGLANWILQEEDILSEQWLPWILQQSQAERKTLIRKETGAVFCGLEEGVYLVRQTESGKGFSDIQPFLQWIPEGDGWDIVKQPSVIRLTQSPATGDHPAPIIGAMGIGFCVAALMVLIDGRKK
ncbi:MAG: hypothetical protein ACI3V0_12225 [Faecousia sp.]